MKAYSFGPSSEHSSVDVVYERCRLTPNATRCFVNLATVSGDSPSDCNELATLAGISGDTTNSTIAMSHGISVDLSPSPVSLGACSALTRLDSESYTPPTSFDTKYLLAPLQCDNMASCSNRTSDSTDHWLIVEKNRTLGVRFVPFLTIN